MESSIKPPKKGAAPEADTETPVDANLEPTHEGSNLPSMRSNAVLGAVTGETTQSDVKIPYLQIAYGVGKLSKDFNPGDFVLGGEHLLVHKREKLVVVVLTAQKFYKERLSKQELDSGLRPRSYTTELEVIKNGGSTEWKDGPNKTRIGPSFGPAMDMKLLIRKPDALDQGVFGLELDGAFYAPCYFSVDKSGYNRVGKEIVSAGGLALAKVGLLAGLWELTTDIEEINGNQTVVPRIKLVGRTTEQFRREVMERFAPQTAPTPN